MDAGVLRIPVAWPVSLCPPVNSFHVSRWMLLPTATSLSLSLNSPCSGHLAHHCLDSGRCPLIVDCCPLCHCVCLSCVVVCDISPGWGVFRVNPRGAVTLRTCRKCWSLIKHKSIHFYSDCDGGGWVQQFYKHCSLTGRWVGIPSVSVAWVLHGDVLGSCWSMEGTSVWPWVLWPREVGTGQLRRLSRGHRI